MTESDEPRQLSSPDVSNLAAISKFMTELDELTKRTRVYISSTYTLGLRYAGDLTGLQFSWDPESSTYRATPVTYTITKGGAY